MDTNRRDALLWWNALSILNKSSRAEAYFPGIEWFALTGREIEIIYKYEQP